jgi:di/tricarboxylate transporter
MRVSTSFILVLILACVASGIAVTHMNNIPSLVVIGPGYLVQAWLFEHHLALGGFGYQATMVTVSALVWTLIIFGLVGAARLVGRFARGGRAA